MSRATPSGPTSADPTDSGPGPLSGPGPSVGHEAAGVAAGGEIIRHEQRLRVSTVRQPVRTVRYTRRVVTETRMIPVEVRREILDVEEIETPAPDRPQLHDPSGPPADEIEIVLHEQVPVISFEIRAVETVRIAVRSVDSTVDVTEELSSERIAVDQSAMGR